MTISCIFIIIIILPPGSQKLLVVSKRYFDKTLDLTRGEIDTTWFWLWSYLPFNAKSRKSCYLYYFLTVRSSNLKPISMSHGGFCKL